MSPTTRRRLGIALGAFGFAAGVVALLVHGLTGRIADIVDNFVLHTGSSAIVLGAIALAAVRRQPFNRAVWALLVIVTAQGLEMAGWAYTAAVAPDAGAASFQEIVHGSAAPSDLPLDLALAQWLAWTVWAVGLVGWMTFGFMWFPDGSLPSRRWRWLPPVAGAGLAVLTAAYASAFHPGSDLAYATGNQGLGGAPAIALGAGAFLSVIAVVGTVVSLFARYRRAESDVRDGLKWIGLGAVVLAVVMLAGFPFGEDAVSAAGLVALPILFTSYGIAILRHRAFDIDLVISRTLVYGSLAVFITVVYIAIVVGVDLVVAGADGTPNPVVSLAAITVVAITVQPLRRRLTAFANRLVYGRRATPYEVLSEFSQRVAAADEHLLETVARSLVEGTPATAATVWVEDSGALHPAATWPADRARQEPVAVDRGLEGLAATRAFPVFHRDDLMGAIGLWLPPGAELTPADVGLAEQVAGGMGLALRNLSLTERLRHRIEELQESRRRIVKVRDETRRRLERDLHDGAQQRLVALRVRLGLLGRLAESEGSEDLAGAIGDLSKEAQDAIDAVRDFARGVYPPLLESEGLGPALGAQARRLPLPVTVEADVARPAREVEAAVYFSVLEALQNVVKHADASRAAVEVDEVDGELRFRVSDDGRGLGAAGRGSGLRTIQDRIEAVGGTLAVESAPGGGTTVSGRVPVGSPAEVTS